MEQTVLELKAKCEAIEKRESERRAMEERKHAEEIAFLKKTNVQLKVLDLYNLDATRRNSLSTKKIIKSFLSNRFLVLLLNKTLISAVNWCFVKPAKLAVKLFSTPQKAV